MLFSIETEEFLKDLSVLNQVIPRHTTFPILSNIRIDIRKNDIHVFGTDLDTSLSYTSDIAEIEEEGVMIVPAKTLYSMIREIEGKTTFIKEGNRIKVEYNQGYFFLPLMDEEDFPAEPDIKKEEANKVNIEEIKNAIDRLVFIVPEDSAKRNMSGMLWEYNEGLLKMVATDSFRLGFHEIEIDLGEESYEIVIPPKILKQVSASESKEMFIGVDESRIYYVGEKFTMVSSLIKVEFPNYKTAIPENNENILRVNKDSLISSLRRVSVFSDDKPKTIMLELGSDLFLGASSEIGESREEINGEYSGKELNIALSASYLMEILRNVDKEEALLKFGDKNRPVIIESDRENSFYLLMPVVLE